MVKVPVAVAVLEQVESEALSLDHELTLRQSDFVDGAGDLVWQEPGGRYAIAVLLSKSLENSDSTATDMLVRHIGENALNNRIRTWVGPGFGRITTILQVRYDAYGQLHPRVAELSNMDLVRMRSAGTSEARLDFLTELLDIERSELSMDSVDAAFEQYYRQGANSATLIAYALLLERLARGELLSRAHTERLLGHMRRITTGNRRIQAGLSPGARFAQKTGTQLGRACNAGIIESSIAPNKPQVVVVACAERFGSLDRAEQAFQSIGAALQEFVLVD